jgi:hypothetical protein
VEILQTRVKKVTEKRIRIRIQSGNGHSRTGKLRWSNPSGKCVDQLSKAFKTSVNPVW